MGVPNRLMDDLGVYDLDQFHETILFVPGYSGERICFVFRFLRYA